MRLLVVEDELKLAQYLLKGLSENGHVVDLARDDEATVCTRTGWSRT
jgi:DNA-binding response OmpR family regulator